MKYTILTENAVGGLVGNEVGDVREFDAIEMGQLSDDMINLYMPVTEKYLKEDPDGFPALQEYSSAKFGLKVNAGFDNTKRVWCVAI